jgi:hypothetical protein
MDRFHVYEKLPIVVIFVCFAGFLMVHILPNVSLWAANNDHVSIETAGGWHIPRLPMVTARPVP